MESDERIEELKALRNFERTIRNAHEKHLRTGDYTPLGIAAQDALMQLNREFKEIAAARYTT